MCSNLLFNGHGPEPIMCRALGAIGVVCGHFSQTGEKKSTSNPPSSELNQNIERLEYEVFPDLETMFRGISENLQRADSRTNTYGLAIVLKSRRNESRHDS